MEKEIEAEGDGCVSRDDLISLVTEERTDRKERLRVRDHLQGCDSCREETREMEGFTSRDLAEELADCYHQVDLAEIEVPEDFLDRFFRKKPSFEE